MARNLPTALLGASSDRQVRADLTLRDASGGTALHAAALMGHMDVAAGRKTRYHRRGTEYISQVEVIYEVIMNDVYTSGCWFDSSNFPCRALGSMFAMWDWPN